MTNGETIALIECGVIAVYALGGALTSRFEGTDSGSVYGAETWVLTGKELECAVGLRRGVILRSPPQ
jgi:hypothetical protein